MIDETIKGARRNGARLARRLLQRRRPATRRTAPEAVAPPSGARTADSTDPLIDVLERGGALDRAMLVEVRALLAAGEAGRALAIAQSLLSHRHTRELGSAAAGVIAHHRGYETLAWSHLRDLPAATWARLAPAEHVRAGLSLAPDEARRAVEGLLDEDPPDVPAESWYEILAAVFGHGDQELARRVFASFDRHVESEVPGWPDGPLHRDWLRPWVAADADSPSAPAPPAGRPVLAILDYGHPGAMRASANIGDHIQSIAGLAHVVRHQDVRMHGDGELVGLLDTLRERVRPEFRRDDLQGDLEVVPVHRDASMYQPVPEGTWVLCLGWYMHALFTMRHGFPLHRNLRPIFVSFHCNKRDLLTPAAVEYLRRYGPVGCRDWTTVHLLTSMDIPAFFSGCVTTTIDAVFPDVPAPAPDAPVAYVDALAPPGAVTYAHSSPKVRQRSFVANAKVALDRLDTYRRDHSRVVTSRLHCHLPLRSIGVDTEFVPANPADVRFAGLAGISDDAFEAIRSGLTEKFERVVRAILAGAPEDAVYAAWREATAADVAAAAREHGRPVKLDPPAQKWDRRVPRARAGTVTKGRRSAAGSGAEVHCAVLLRRPEPRGVAALLDSLVEHASRPVHLWIVSPGDTGERIARAFPEVTVSSIPNGPLGRRGRQLGLVLLPGLIDDDVERLVVLPSPAIATDDICQLADLELGSHALAAATRPGTAGVSGFGVINAAANRLRDQPVAAAELRRAVLARHAFDFDAFAPAPLVLDLGRMRRERFTEEALSLAGTFRLRDIEILHFLFGPERAPVPERWAVVPTRTPERGAGLLHWADRPKPWQPRLTPERELWHRHAVTL